MQGNKRKGQLVSMILNEPLNYERMLEVSTDQLEFLKHECDVAMSDLKKDIIQEYEIIKPSLARMRDWKQQLIEVREKREAYKLFLSIDKNQSLLSCATNNEERKPLSFSQLFQDIENDSLDEPPPLPPQPPQPTKSPKHKQETAPTPRRIPPNARPSTPVKKSSIPVRRNSVSDDRPQSSPNLNGTISGRASKK